MTALLTLVQWLSPAFPTGAFAYSHGLEQAVASGNNKLSKFANAALQDLQ